MTSTIIGATLVVSLYSLWVRRDTWWSRWEIGASVAIAVDACALLFMSPWASATLGPALYEILGYWNVQQLLGHICLILAVVAIAYHALLRLAEIDQVRGLLRRYVTVPTTVGIGIMATLFLIADVEYQDDMFLGGDRNQLLNVYWLIATGVLIYVSVYTGRVLLIARTDPRSRETANIYLISGGFGVSGCLVQAASRWFPGDVSTLVWLCACLAISSFAYGSARSWRAKVAWFTCARDGPPAPTSPTAPPGLTA